MRISTNHKPTIGFISTWPVYQGTTIDRYAHSLIQGISADYLTDCFRQELGITPITCIRRYRIRQACELLRNSQQSIAQIALAVGFSDGAHFARTFLREAGMTPRAYRDNKQM